VNAAADLDQCGSPALKGDGGSDTHDALEVAPAPAAALSALLGRGMDGRRVSLKGTVLRFDPARREGTIRADDGRLYPVRQAELVEGRPLHPGQAVEFLTDGARYPVARRVRPVRPAQADSAR
jgi:hypothetical protein